MLAAGKQGEILKSSAKLLGAQTGSKAPPWFYYSINTPACQYNPLT